MARALQRILSKHQRKVCFRENKSALLVVFADNNHNAIAQLVKSWMYTSTSVTQDNKPSESS